MPSGKTFNMIGNSFNSFNHIYSSYLNMDAIFSDETESFVSPAEPSSIEPVTISIRTAKNNVDTLFLHIDEKRYRLKKIKSENLFDYSAVTIKPIKKKINYYFSIEKNQTTYYYNKRGLHKSIDFNFNFTLIPDFKIPLWAKGAVMYQIYVDRFYNGDESNDVVNNEYAYLSKAAKKIEHWNQPVNPQDICNFYGGDLKGVMDKMSYLKELGIDVIYFNPIFVSPSNHKYDTQDYDYIDPHYGVIIEDGGSPLYFEKFHNKYATMYMKRTTDKINLEASNKLMVDLITLAHKNNIRVIIDGVFNHCGAFNKWLDKEGFYNKNGYPAGAYKSASSPYHDYFKWYDVNWPNNDCYDGWWGHDNHPKLNYEASKELYNYILEVAARWVSPPFNADGWRLDVASDLGSSEEFNHKFWQDFRRSVKKANPEAIIIAEHYGDPSKWLLGNEWDTVMNYDAFMEPITWFLTGMEKHSEDFKMEMLCNAMVFENTMRYFMSKFSMQSLSISMNELSNHDHSRFLTRTNMQPGRLHTKGAKSADEGINKNIFMEAVTFQMTWPGAPTIYYGDEAGLCGWTDPDNRRTYPWGKEDLVLLEFHKEIIKIHKKHSALKSGSVEFLYTNYGIISYGRWNKQNKIVVILNNNNSTQKLTIPVWKIGTKLMGSMESVIVTHSNTFNLDKTIYKIINGKIELEVQPFSSLVLCEV